METVEGLTVVQIKLNLPTGGILIIPEYTRVIVDVLDNIALAADLHFQIHPNEYKIIN